MFKAIYPAIGLAVLLLVAVGTVGAQQGDPNRGKVLWEEVHSCRLCHGEMGEGKYASARASDRESLSDWMVQIRGTEGFMPSFSPAQVSDQDVADLHAYMQALPRTMTAAPWRAPVSLEPGEAQGSMLFQQRRCFVCHGDGSELVNFFLLGPGRSGDEALLRQIRTPSGLMPSYSESQVTPEDAQEIAGFLRSLAVPGVDLQLGFRSLAGLIPRIVGKPVENEHAVANGDRIQRTTGGLLVWRSADNWTAFTDGARTWVNGPLGLQQRANDARFDWERAGR